MTHATHVNGWEPAVYMSSVSQNFRLFLVSNLFVQNFRIFSAHVTWVALTPAGLYVSFSAAEAAPRDLHYAITYVAVGTWPGTGPVRRKKRDNNLQIAILYIPPVPE